MGEDFPVIKEYIDQLNTFFVNETRAETEEYFERYWLGGVEYIAKWRDLQNSVFDRTAKHLPDMMFNPGLDILPLIGGDIFTSERDFSQLKNCMHSVGDNYFTVIQNKDVIVKVYYGNDGWKVHPQLKFRFPVNISWDELMSGGYVSTELFASSYKDFFIFGDGGYWGRYSAPEYVSPSNIIAGDSDPINVMGFKREYGDVFRKEFQVESEIVALDRLPDSYVERVLGHNL